MEKKIQITGISPYRHQKDVINILEKSRGTGLTIVVNSPRQRGKSYLVSNALLYFGCNYENTSSFYLAPTLKQSKSVYRFVLDGIIHTGIVRRKNSTDLLIELINGSTIQFKSAQQKDALRGFTCSGLLCIDEAAFIPDDVFSVILPWVSVYNAPIMLTSSPWTKNGFFYRYYCYGREGSHNTITIDWADEKYKDSISKLLSPERLAEIRAILPQNVFNTDYLGLFLDEDSLVFPHLKECVKWAEIGPNDQLYVGIDWSNQGENDDTVVSVFNQKGEQVFLRYWNNLSPLKQIDQIVKELEPYQSKIRLISCETNSLGTPYTELLKSKSQNLGNKVVGFNTSNTSKNAIVVNFQTALEAGEVSLLPDDKQIAQFGYFSAEYNPQTRTVKYSAPNGLHDDCVMATLIGYDCYRQGTSRGQYNIIFRSNKYGNKSY